MKIEGKTLALLAVLMFVLFSPKGGDSPSPSPRNDVLAAQKAGEEYLRGLANVFEQTADRLDENPELVSTIGADVKEQTRAVRESSDNDLERRLQGAIDNSLETARLYRAFAKGYRGVAE